MEFIGTNRQPAPLLKNVVIKNPKKVFDQVISYMQLMFSKSKLIHSDLSPFNILYHDDTPILIDLGQAVLKDHPQAVSFLHRDIQTMQKFFNRYKIDVLSEETLFQMITKNDDVNTL
jgi:RIO kinase 1